MIDNLTFFFENIPLIIKELPSCLVFSNSCRLCLYDVCSDPTKTWTFAYGSLQV
ncbi:hypothetical protein HanIR_Chr02g0096161 [Helianthus annuus]|nr:hypothetical protein HanIR_Chr02g0096161 [Helianthus annuus]